MTAPKHTRKATEKIWNVLQEIEEKRQLGSENSPVRIVYYPTPQQSRDIGGLFEARKTVLEKLQSLKAIDNLHKVLAGKLYYWAFRLGKTYSKVFRQYEKLYFEMARQYEEDKKTPSEKPDYSFDKDRGILTIKGNRITFKVGGRRIPYLDCVIKSKDYAYHSEIAEELEGANQIKEAKNTYYEVCRGIKARLLDYGITDFLEFDFNKARINPLYKKVAK